MKIALLGYGKMGKAIEEIALKRAHNIVLATNEDITTDELKKADIAIEFSKPEVAVSNIIKCFSVNLPVVVGTTGWYEQFETIKKQCITTNQALFYATNFSVGVNIFLEANRYLAKLMNKHLSYNVAIEEIHHTQKLDSPSGTAITTAETILNELKRKTGWKENTTTNNEINITSFREGNVPGTHIVTYENEVDKIQIKHEAKGRIGFASGAVDAAEWLVEKKGIYTMKDMLSF